MPPYDVNQLLNMSAADLDALFGKSPAGPIPNGPANGTALVDTGKPASKEIAWLVHHFAWQGKTFDGPHGTLRNRITTFGIPEIVAEVYEDKSLADGKPCIVLDYSKTSIIAERVRDEIRLIAPNTYLGKVYWDNKATIHFALQFGG
jgi:hypothetical protein